MELSHAELALIAYFRKMHGEHAEILLLTAEELAKRQADENAQVRFTVIQGGKS